MGFLSISISHRKLLGLSAHAYAYARVRVCVCVCLRGPHHPLTVQEEDGDVKHCRHRASIHVTLLLLEWATVHGPWSSCDGDKNLVNIPLRS